MLSSVKFSSRCFSSPPSRPNFSICLYKAWCVFVHSLHLVPCRGFRGRIQFVDVAQARLWATGLRAVVWILILKCLGSTCARVKSVFRRQCSCRRMRLPGLQRIERSQPRCGLLVHKTVGRRCLYCPGCCPAPYIAAWQNWVHEVTSVMDIVATVRVPNKGTRARWSTGVGPPSPVVAAKNCAASTV